MSEKWEIVCDNCGYKNDGRATECIICKKPLLCEETK